MDDTAVEQEKQERINQEREKAAEDLLEQEAKQNKINQGYFGSKEYGRIRGYSKDPEAIRKSLERLARIGVGLVLLGIAVFLFSLALTAVI